MIAKRNIRRLFLAALATVFVAGCGGSDDGPVAPSQPVERSQFVQTWESAMGSASATAVTPYFPSTAAQTTGIVVPGVAVTPALTPPANTVATVGVFANTTIRQIFHVSVGGTTVRLRLSNAYSPTDLTIDEIHLALFDKAACQPPAVPVLPATAARGTTCTNIVASSDRTVTVNGNKAFTIPRGQEIYTDSVQLQLPTQGDVAVSFYVKNQTPSLTTHSVGDATAYYAVGLPTTTANYTGATALDAATIGGRAALATATSIVVATGIDVMASSRTRSIVAFGDSITDGNNTVVDTSTRWIDVLSGRLQQASRLDGKLAVAISNAGISGNRVASDNPNITQGIAGTRRFSQDALTRSGVTDVIVLIGINDVGQVSPPTPSATIIAGYRELIRQARAANLKIYFATLTPIRSDVATATGVYNGSYSRDAATFAANEAVRLELNAWVRSSKEHDGVIDFNAAVSAPGRLDQMAAQLNANLLTGTYDQLHPNGYGYQAMGEAVDLTWFR